MDVESSRALAVAILSAFVLLVTLVIVATAWVVVHHRRAWNFAALILAPMLGVRPVQRMRQRYPRSWAFVGSRLDPGQYLGLHLTVGLALSAAAIGVFVVVADTVFEPSDLLAVDRVAPQILHTGVGVGAVPAFNVLTSLGDLLVLTVVTVIAVLALLATRRTMSAVAVTVGATGVWALVTLLKLLFGRARPVPLPGAHLPESFSFPSGHAMAGLVIYGLLAYVVALSLRSSTARIIVFVLTGLLIVLVGISRVYLGVHYFSDVIGGYAGGAVWLASIVSACEVVRRRRRSTAAPARAG